MRRGHFLHARRFGRRRHQADVLARGRAAGCQYKHGHSDSCGWPTDAAIDRSEHELADWELLTDALVGALGRHGVMTVDQLRRGIESMPRDEYERASYYERWLYSAETILTEKGVLAPGELDARLGRRGIARASGCRRRPGRRQAITGPPATHRARPAAAG